MPSAPPNVSNSALWTGRVLSALVSLLFIFDSVMKFRKSVQSVGAFVHLGIPIAFVIPIGVILLVCTAIYVLPQTSILGAILLTGYLGGAVLAHLRAGDPITRVLSPTYVGAVVWLGLYLRDPRLRALVPFRT